MYTHRDRDRYTHRDAYIYIQTDTQTADTCIRETQRHTHVYTHRETEIYTHKDTYIYTGRHTETANIYSRGTHMYTEGRRKRELTKRGEIIKVMFKASLGTRDLVQHTHTLHPVLQFPFTSTRQITKTGADVRDAFGRTNFRMKIGQFFPSVVHSICFHLWPDIHLFKY